MSSSAAGAAVTASASAAAPLRCPGSLADRHVISPCISGRARSSGGGNLYLRGNAGFLDAIVCAEGTLEDEHDVIGSVID